LISFSTTSGTVATRFSPGKISRGTPILSAIQTSIFMNRFEKNSKTRKARGFFRSGEIADPGRMIRHPTKPRIP
jgi:hypothetical protein